MKTFTHLSKKECLAEHKNIIFNANAKFNAAETIAQTGDYGTAMSLQIIGLEEMMKAFILFLDGNGFDFRKVKGMNSIFENHGLRYLFSFFMFLFYIFGNTISVFFRLSMRFIKAKGIEEAQKSMSDERTGEILFIQKVGPFIIKKLKFIFEELEWYKNFDKIRQDGMYSGYDNQLKSPLSIEKDYYLNVKNRIDVVKNITQKITSELSQDDELTSKMLLLNIKSFKEKQIYDWLEWLIDYTKKNRINAFDAIMNGLSDLIPDFEEKILEKQKLVHSGC